MSIRKSQSSENFGPETLISISKLSGAFDENDADDANENLFSRWWNGKFAHQRFIVHFVEQTLFHVIIVSLVVFDCVLVVGELLLDFILLNQEKDQRNVTCQTGEEPEFPELDLAIEILHLGSLVLLGFFVLEVLVKIYSSGKKWWNIREKKMEWLDAIIVIVSFIIDIYFIKKPNAIAEISLLFISFRLWRIVRIINSVAQSIRSKDEAAKKHLTEIYSQILENLIELSTKKSKSLLGLRSEFSRSQLEKIIEKFDEADRACRSKTTPHSKSSNETQTHESHHHLQTLLDEIRSASSKLDD